MMDMLETRFSFNNINKMGSVEGIMVFILHQKTKEYDN